MPGPADAANVLRTAAANAGAIELANQQTQAADPNAREASAFDVWTYTGSGLDERIADPSAQGNPDAALMEGLGGEWASADADTVADSMSAQASDAWNQFQVLTGMAEPPPGQQAPEGFLANVGATFAILTGLEQLISAPLAAIPFPAFPAIRVLDMDIGLPHAHNHPPNLVPPAPPVPLPSTGPIIPIPFLSGAAKTLINGMPAARCGDMGLGIWCGGYFPMYEVFLGSSSVWIEGARAGRLLVDITKHCIFTSPKPSDPPMGPMVGMTISSSGNVLIGGVPMPSLLSFALGAAMRGLFAGLGRAVRALRSLRQAARAARAARQAGRAGARGSGRAASRAARSPAARAAGAPRAGMRNIGDGLDHMRGRPYSRTMPCSTDRVDDLLRRMPDSGDALPLPNGIYASELCEMTRRTGDEFAVVVDEAGDLRIRRGTSSEVPVDPGEQCLVHTHPQSYDNYDTAISHGDQNLAGAHATDHGWSHPQSVIDADGNIHAFDGNGVVENPVVSPVHQDGLIDGVHTNPNGAPMQAVPPQMLPTVPT